MDMTALVSVDIGKGLEVLKALERANIKVNVALWAVLPEYEDWRLVVAARKFDLLGPLDAYGLLNDSLDAAGMTTRTTPPIMILRMNDPFIRDLRRTFTKARSVEGMRLGGQVFGDRFIEDAYVYRIS